MAQHDERPAGQEVVEEVRPLYTSAQPAEAIDTVETRYLSQDKPLLESVIRDTASPGRDSVLMEVDPEGGSKSLQQGADLLGPSFADMVAGRNTSVFRPTPVEASALTIQHSASRSQSEVAEVALTVPGKPRPICLVSSGHPVSPMPSSQPLSGQLPEETTRA